MQDSDFGDDLGWLEQDDLLINLKKYLEAEYEFFDITGSGSTGQVWKVKNKSLGRIEAVKVLKIKDELDFSERIARFRLEARSLAILKNRYRDLYIPDVYDFCQYETLFYYTMKYLDGISLNEVIANHQLPMKYILETIRDLTEILTIVHQNNIIHRDIKPENIIISEKNAWLVDFGIAKQLGDVQQITETGVILGTPNYMSPEQALGHPISFLSDIYSLGAVLYEMITREMYIDARSTVAILQAIVYGDSKLPSEIVTDLDPRIDTICEKALHKNFRKRYQNADEMKKDIEDVLKTL